jgi:hypothetical protein
MIVVDMHLYATGAFKPSVGNGTTKPKLNRSERASANLKSGGGNGANCTFSKYAGNAGMGCNLVTTHGTKPFKPVEGLKLGGLEQSPKVRCRPWCSSSVGGIPPVGIHL